MKTLALLLFSLVASAPFCCAADDPLNQLSAAEQEAGWQSLFDGRTLNGWRGYRKQPFADSWAVAGNAVFCTGSGNTHLITEQVYSNFELSIDWRIALGGNSGVLLRCDESDPYPAGCAIELQVIDDSEGWKSVHNYGLGPGNSAGAVYGFYPADLKGVKPAGQWNQTRVRLERGLLKVWHNGAQICDTNMDGEEWHARLATSKFAKSKRFNKTARGGIVLQNYKGLGVWYRNIKLRQLPVPPLAAGAPTTYVPFNPSRWRQQKVSTRMRPWAGEQIVFLSKNAKLDPALMGTLVDRLDRGWQLYATLTGHVPPAGRLIDGRVPLAAVPHAGLSCGVGCGYINSTGIEFGKFYSEDYPMLQADANAMPHYMFYEMGRNFYGFGDRHSLFITGFAVFMRYVCMDTLGCTDPDRPVRDTIERAEEVYAASNIPFLDAFTNLAGRNEKGNRLKEANGQQLIPSDQPVMYATAMLKLWQEEGGNAWLKRFYTQLALCPEVKPRNDPAALRQSLNWLVAASVAARRDLTPIFVDRWRMPMDAATRATFAGISWKDESLTADAIISSLAK